jgi:hypothetical protein
LGQFSSDFVNSVARIMTLAPQAGTPLAGQNDETVPFGG